MLEWAPPEMMNEPDPEQQREVEEEDEAAADTPPQEQQEGEKDKKGSSADLQGMESKADSNGVHYFGTEAPSVNDSKLCKWLR